MAYTASFAFFEALWEAGVSHCFVTLGSTHPSLLEAMVKGQKEKADHFPRIITCPTENVALSMADGFARVTRAAQCVIVAEDVGTLALGSSVHNASSGRCSVLIFAALSPFTIEGEMRGTRSESVHWIQGVRDPKAIVDQYCRYSAEIKTGKNVKQMVNRALQWACSDPKGPVYLCAAREVMEEELERYKLEQTHWAPVEPAALSPTAVVRIAEALVEAREPLLITGYSGRNHAMAPALVQLADTVKGLKVLDTGGSDMCFPADHRGWLGMRYGVDKAIETADMILVIDCDVPWINTRCHPHRAAKIFHIDVDPLKHQMPVFYIAATARFQADSFTAITQIIKSIAASEVCVRKLSRQAVSQRWDALAVSHWKRVQSIAEAAKPKKDGTFGCGFLCETIKRLVPRDTIYAIEAVTNAPLVADNIQAIMPGSWINCGGGGPGWSGGGALGIKLATEYLSGPGNGKFVVQIVGDGSFLSSIPGSVYWISQRYKIPCLTIVLNNNGWNAPKKSLLLVHPEGLGSKATNEELHISLAPAPDYSGIAKAAAGGEIFAAKVAKASELEHVLKQAIDSVLTGMTAVVDAVVVTGNSEQQSLSVREPVRSEAVRTI